MLSLYHIFSFQMSGSIIFRLVCCQSCVALDPFDGRYDDDRKSAAEKFDLGTVAGSWSICDADTGKDVFREAERMACICKRIGTNAVIVLLQVGTIRSYLRGLGYGFALIF
jgi:hypothetical protein